MVFANGLSTHNRVQCSYKVRQGQSKQAKPKQNIDNLIRLYTFLICNKKQVLYVKGMITMCIKREEMDNKIKEIRELKAMKEELENNLKALENEVIEYCKENEVDEVLGNDFKVTYKPQERKTLDKKALENDLGDLSDYTKVTTYNVLRIK